jgi:hypothetical protein
MERMASIVRQIRFKPVSKYVKTGIDKNKKETKTSYTETNRLLFLIYVWQINIIDNWELIS